MPASDVPGYVQGFRFNAANYGGGEFTDQSGYGGPLRTINGAPTFQTVDTHEGLLLDNTWHGAFWHPNAWQGTVILVTRLMRLSSGTLIRSIVTFSNDGASGSVGRLQTVFFGNDRRVQMTSLGTGKAGHEMLSDAQIGAVALGQDQQRRMTFSTLDGVTVKSSGPDTATTNGQSNAMGSNEFGAVFGALQADSSNTMPETATGIHVFEMHFFEANPIVDAETEMQAYLAELATTYSF